MGLDSGLPEHSDSFRKQRYRKPGLVCLLAPRFHPSSRQAVTQGLVTKDGRTLAFTERTNLSTRRITAHHEVTAWTEYLLANAISFPHFTRCVFFSPKYVLLRRVSKHCHSEAGRGASLYSSWGFLPGRLRALRPLNKSSGGEESGAGCRGPTCS